MPVTKSGAELLTAAEAARLLGVTPELLFAYAIYPPKKALGHERTLTYSIEGEVMGFYRTELESFDEYLREPWSVPGASRPALPTYIADYLKVECGGQCARCGRGYKLENAHIIPYAQSRSHHHHNLIRLCVDCHEAFETKRLIPYGEIHELKKRLISQVRERLVVGTNPSPVGIGRSPNPAPNFVGREHELATLLETLNSKRSISIEGPAGIGKTQLLLNALRNSSHARPILWINVEVYKTVVELKQALSSALAPGNAVRPFEVSEVLADADVRVIFDGVEQLSPDDMDELNDFFGLLLAGTFSPQFIFTSQVELATLEIEERIQLYPIQPEAALLVLRAGLGGGLRDSPAEMNALLELIAFCEGHPLSLHITKGLLSHFKSSQAVLKRIGKHGATVLQIPMRKRHTTKTSLRVCLLVSYQTLTPAQRRVLWLASQCPAGFVAEILEHSKEFGVEDSDGDIAVLRRWHLADVDTEVPIWTRLVVLSPIRAFVNAEWDTGNYPEKDTLQYQLMAHLTIQAGVLDHTYMQQGDVANGVLRFEMEFPNYIYAYRAAVNRGGDKFLELAALLASSLMAYCFVRGFVELGIEIMRIGAEAAARVGRTHQASEILTRLVALAQRSDDLEVIRAAAEELNRFANLSSDPVLIANAASGRGALALMEQRFDDAADAYAAAATQYRKAGRTRSARVRQVDSSLLGADDWIVHMLSLTLKQQGFVHEQAGRPAEALPFYEQALELIRNAGDQINLGSVLHQIGNCAADTGEKDRAFEAYGEAARQFQAIDMEEFLSNSLSEVGYLLISWDPPSSIDVMFPADLIEDGLIDVLRQVQRVFTLSALELPVREGTHVLRKVFGMTALVSFSSSNHLLDDWAYILREKTLRPLVSSARLESRSAFDKILLMHLDLTLALAGTLSEVGMNGGRASAPSLPEIEHYARICYKYYDWGWAVFHPFEWLATYLRRHRGVPLANPEVLQRAAEVAETENQPFSLGFF
jgi:tetratricopeptide (TPR) repeat protein